MKVQNACYEKGNNVDGSPLLCNKKYYSYPIFNQNFFLWKVNCLNIIADGINVNDLFNISLSFIEFHSKFPLIENVNFFYKNEFKSFIYTLINEKVIKVKSNVIYLLTTPLWFKDYLSREVYQNKRAFKI